MTRPAAIAQRLRPEDVQSAVDAVLTEHDAYVPLQLLLLLGLLEQADHAAWRCGDMAYLPATLTAAQPVVRILRIAASWAQELGLEPEQQICYGMGKQTGRQLRFCASDTDECAALLTTRYVRASAAAAGSQLDLFLDSGPAIALRELRAALCAQDADAAGSAFADLVAQAPQHRLRPPARQLLDALPALDTGLLPSQAATELAYLERTLTPAAELLLGTRAADLLAPWWRRLATALRETAFDPDAPRLHGSYACLQAGDWAQAAAQVESVPGYEGQAILLARLASAYTGGGRHRAAMAVYCRLCWQFTATAAAMLDKLPASAARLRTAWAAFQVLDVDPQPGVDLFPAYLLLLEPELEYALPEDVAAVAGTGAQAFRSVCQLLHKDNIERRQALQDLQPWLLRTYLHLHVRA